MDQFIPLYVPKQLTSEEIKGFKRDALRKIENTSEEANIQVMPGDVLVYEYVIEFGTAPIYGLCDAPSNAGPPCHLKANHKGPHKSINTWKNEHSKEIK